jgi:hypothetical protein
MTTYEKEQGELRALGGEVAELIERRFGFKASFVLSFVAQDAHAVSYTIGGDRSVALLGLRALLEKGEPININGRQIEPQSFIEMELQPPDGGDYAWNTGTRIVPALVELNEVLRGQGPSSEDPG